MLQARCDRTRCPRWIDRDNPHQFLLQALRFELCDNTRAYTHAHLEGCKLRQCIGRNIECLPFSKRLKVTVQDIDIAPQNQSGLEVQVSPPHSRQLLPDQLEQ
jgi:hypothetical protein